MVDKLWLLKLRYLAEIFLGNERSDSATMGLGVAIIWRNPLSGPE